MKKNDLKRQLRTEAEQFVPDNKEQIMKKLSIDPQPKFKRKSLNFSFKFSLVFTIILVSIIGICFALTNPVTATNSIVTIEINPAFELELDKEDNLVDIRGLNLDGVLVIESLDNYWTNLTKTEIINNIIDMSIKLGYLNSHNTINISAINPNTKKETAIANVFRTELEKVISERQLEINVENNNDNEDYKALARKHKVSVGKMNAIQRAMQADNSLTINKALEMTPKQLNEIINHYNRQKNKDFKDNYDRQLEAFEQYYKRINLELNAYQNNLDEQIEAIEKNIGNSSISQATIELQIRNLIEFLNINDYDFNPNDEDDKYDYYLDVLNDIKDYASDYYDDLIDYIEEQLEESNANLKKYIRDQIKNNPDDFIFDFELKDNLDDIIKNRGHGNQNGHHGRNN